MKIKEFDWLITHPEEERKYSGEYIAIVDEGIVAHGKDLKYVLEEAERKTGKEPFIHKVSLPDREVVV